ncbi:MAG: DUF4142 domain-containing protein [Terriglobales bacterium]
MNLNFRLFVFGLVLACLPLTAFAQSSTPSQPGDTMGQPATGQSTMGQSGMSHDQMGNSSMSASDKKFVREAAQGGMAEVELGKIAAEKGSTDDVKKFGQRMVDDHSKANDQLKQIASEQGIQLPQELNSKDKALKARLSKLDGASFDKAYMANMVKDHKADIAEFTKESNNGKDDAIKQFATSTLPTLKSHLEEAEHIEPMVQGSSTRASK